MDSIGDLQFAHDSGGRLTSVNEAFLHVTGYSKRELAERSLFDLVTPSSRRELEQILEAARDRRDNPEPLRAGCSLDLQTATGELLRLSASVEVRHGDSPGPSLAGVAWLEGQGMEARLREKSQELGRYARHLQILHHLSTTDYPSLEALFEGYLAAGREIFQAQYGVIAQLQHGTRVVRASSQADDRDSLAKASPDPLWALLTREMRTMVVAPADAARFGLPFYGYFGAPIVAGGQLFGAISFWNTPDAAPPPIHLQAREVLEMMARGLALAIHQQRLREQLAHQAKHDSLTGLPNRLFLSDRLEVALTEAQRLSQELAVVFIDLDRFKQINDTLGHAVGDELLRHMGRRLRRCLPESDFLARMGGDEFTAILSGFRLREEAVERVRRMLAAVRLPCHVEHHELFVTASIGVSFFPKDGRDGVSLLRTADSAMYTAKNRGKNDLFCFHKERTPGGYDRLELETNLRRALENRQLRLMFQPQVDLAGQIQSQEVLLAWDHPKHGRISAAEFIPVAEETGLIIPIGDWVLREACRHLAEWRSERLPSVPLAVNVSALQFALTGFVSSVGGVLAEFDLPPELLELELTESLVMRDFEMVAHRLSALRRLGVRIAIDDFGTGYSSLSYLRRLPADHLKIDRSFLLDNDDRAPGTLPLIRSIVIMAHNLGLSVTAEGVETMAQFDLVRDAGCDRVQGHLFGTPVDAGKAREQLTRRQKTAAAN